MKKFHTILFTILFVSCIGTSFAKQSETANNCAKLGVEITNLTDTTCTLTNYSLNQGEFRYTSSVPAFISAGTTTAPITIQQTMMGPDIDISYQCGPDKSITIKSHQGYCFFYAGTIDGTVLSADNMSAEHTIQSGSFFWSKEGKISWNIK